MPTRDKMSDTKKAGTRAQRDADETKIFHRLPRLDFDDVAEGI